jgi:poly-gamma-glutamate capsule biosynthesis protein CapA/YwtB (metallophosphatase superfamily)
MKKAFVFASVLLLLLGACQPKPSTVTLALLGDLMLGRLTHPGLQSLSYLSPELRAADLSLANLESPLAKPLPASSSGYDLCAPVENAQLLLAWGLDLLSLANNHRYDCGPSGPDDTTRLLLSAGLAPVGPAPQPLYRQVNHLKLAFLSFDDILAPIATPIAIQAIRSAQAAGAVVVVSVHWGTEYQSGPSDRQRSLAQQFAAAGAVLIVGTHPHVLQPAEYIPTSSGKTLVFYSLGNALFDQPGLPDTRQSALVLVTLDAHGVISARAIPFVIDVPRSLIINPDPQAAAHIQMQLSLP